MYKLSKRYQAVFDVSGRQAYGDVRLRKGKTSVRLAGTHDPIYAINQDHLFGTTLDNQRLTCIDCVSSGSGTGGKAGGEEHWYSRLFPHYVVVGQKHLHPDAASIAAIHFRTDDLDTLFYDFDAFGHAIDARPFIDSVLTERRKMRPVKTGDWPQIAYFTGKSTIVEVTTPIGRVTASHAPRSNMGGPRGVYIKNRIRIEIEPGELVSLPEAVNRLGVMHRFLCAFAGRELRIKEVLLRTTGEGPTNVLALHWSLAPGRNRKKAVHEPHPGDVPLDPVKRSAEFAAVLRNWIERDAGWRLARNRYFDCARRANTYSVDRLVAAANMFDILPDEALPPSTVLEPELQHTQKQCLDLLAANRQSVDRDSAIAAISRMGKPSLRKKVEFRAARVVEQFDTLHELSWVLRVAIQARNYFVHGPSDIKVKHFWSSMGFLTDALEFVFAASDLIEAGWDAKPWIGDAHGVGHTFARFRWGYAERLAALKAAVQ